MKITQFLDKVDACTKGMAKEQLRSFVHEMARKLPENRRYDFMESLEKFSITHSDEEMMTDRDFDTELSKAVEDIIQKLEAINEGEICLDSEYNEEYDDWYSDDDDEILFSDPEKLVTDIQNAIDLMHKCIDMDRIDEGLKLCNSLAYLEVQAEGDYNDYDGTPLGIWDLHERNLLTLDYKKFQKECLYLTYVGNELSERSEELFYLFDSFVYPRVDLEDVLQFGNDELPEFALFLPMWIDYLGKRSDGTASSLLKEAQSMLRDEFALLENARRYSKEHPELYLQLLEMNKETGQADKMMEIGLEAIESVPQELTIRSKIALVTAYYADKLCRFEVRDKCWLEALRSDPTIINYMRVKFLPYDAKQYESQIAAIIQTAFEAAKNSEVRYITASENKRISLLSTNDYCVMLFFEQKFDDMEKLGMSFQGSLGWSTTFMKQGIALLFMLLHEGNSYRSGMKSMVTKAMDACSFSKEDLYLGSCEEDGKSEYEIFMSFIERWKDTLNISDEEVKKWMSKLEAWTKKRVTGIMDGNKRNYYRECASMIAALGETKESLGDVGAKAVLMESYRREYSRRRAFHEELVRYGMKKR